MVSKAYFWQDVFVMFVLHQLKDPYLFKMMCKSMIKLATNGNGLQHSDFERLCDYTWEQYLSWPTPDVPTLIVHDPFFQKLTIPAKVNSDQNDISAIRYIYLMGWNEDFKQTVKSNPKFDAWVFRFQLVRWNHEHLNNFVSFLFTDSKLTESEKRRAIVELETISNDLRYLFHNKHVTLNELTEAIEFFEGVRTSCDFPCACTYYDNSLQYQHLSKYYLRLVINIFTNFKNMIESFQNPIKSNI
jgi:hypothetical protein